MSRLMFPSAQFTSSGGGYADACFKTRKTPQTDYAAGGGGGGRSPPRPQCHPDPGDSRFAHNEFCKTSIAKISRVYPLPSMTITPVASNQSAKVRSPTAPRTTPRIGWQLETLLERDRETGCKAEVISRNACMSPRSSNQSTRLSIPDYGQEYNTLRFEYRVASRAIPGECEIR